MTSDKRGFLGELQRRHVWRVAAAYAVASWLLIQIATQVFPFFDIPNWAVRLVVVLLALGFPVAVVLAWVYELTPAGIRRTEPADSPEAREPLAARAVGRKLDAVIIAILGLAVLLLLGNQFLWRKGMRPAGVATPAAPAQSTSDAAVGTTAHEAIPPASVAVLPFVNESGDEEQRYFSDGLSVDLITALSQFGGLKVISRRSSFQYRDGKASIEAIGRQLGVAHVLEGTVRHAGETVRITVSLVNAADGSTMWSHRYDRPYQDLFGLQDEITKSVAAALQAKLLTSPGAVVQTDRPPSGNLDAYASYQQGRAFNDLGSEAGLRRAVQAYDEAIRIDPRYAAAYARLSLAWNAIAAQTLGGIEAEQANARARQAVATALELDPDSSLAHQARAYLLLNVDMDWAGAEAEARRALQLAPNDPSAQFNLGTALASSGQLQRAVDVSRQALAVDPRHDGWYYGLSVYLAGLGDLDDARRAAATAIALQPEATGYHNQLAIIEILGGHASAAMTAAMQESPGLWRDAAVTLALQVDTDRIAADAALDQLTAKHAGDGAYQIAETHALRRDPDNMFLWLDRAWSVRDPGIGYLLTDPFMLRYKDDPRFAAFCRKAGLPATTDAVAMK
ncbi:MAG: hypothetical protein U1F23_08645 [Lysobacterales bacterium]